jgi:uncharacterized Zn-finger protein
MEMEGAIPHHNNDTGAAIIVVGAKEFKCIGATPPFDHPHIYLNMGDDTEVICPYCSTCYRHDASISEFEAKRIYSGLVSCGQRTSVTPKREIRFAPRVPGKVEILASRVGLRIKRFTRSFARLSVYFLLVLLIEIPIAKLFEWVVESGPHWLQSLEVFQREMVEAVDLLQPLRVFETFYRRCLVLFIDRLSGNISDDNSFLVSIVSIPWYAFQYTILVLVGDPNGLVKPLMLGGMISIFILTVGFIFDTKPKGVSWDVFLFPTLILSVIFSVVGFPLVFLMAKPFIIFGASTLGNFVHAAQLYVTSSAIIALILFAIRVRSEHATVHWLEHLLDRFGLVSRTNAPNRWEDPIV